MLLLPAGAGLQDFCDWGVVLRMLHAPSPAAHSLHPSLPPSARSRLPPTTPAPGTTAEVNDAEDDAVTAAGAMAPSPGSGASSAALQRAALALVGAVMLML